MKIPSATADTIRSFLRILILEEADIGKELSADPLGLLLRVCLNELDWYQWNLSRAETRDHSSEERAYLLCCGAARVFRLVLRDVERFSVPTITIRRDIELSTQCLSLAIHLGIIQHGRRACDLVWAGKCDLKQTDATSYLFLLPEKLVDEAALETDITSHFAAEHSRVLQEHFASPEGRRAEATVRDLLHENVFIWQDHFMGYHAHSLLDEAYFAIAWNELSTHEAFDSFNADQLFGGIRFFNYLLMTAYFNSLAIKHEAFCDAMRQKHPNIRMEDILTISADRGPFVEETYVALNHFGPRFGDFDAVTLEQTWMIYNVVTANRRNLDLLDISSPYLPCIVEVSDSAVVKLTSGRPHALNFLSRSLRRQYPADFDVNQRARERSMQEAMSELLSRAFPAFTYRQNVKIRTGKLIKSDIDYVIIDRDYGDVLICQLKFQEAYQSDFKARTSRMDRLLASCEEWLAVVNEWITEGEAVIRSSLRLPKEMRVTRIRKLVVVRHHAHALYHAQLDEHTAFSTWPQLVNAVLYMEKRQGDFRTINGLFQLLREKIVDAPQRFHHEEDPADYCLDRLTFTIEQKTKEPHGPETES